MSSEYCPDHLIYYRYICPLCRQVKADEDNERLIEAVESSAAATRERDDDFNAALKDLAFKIVNPGDEECPGCRRITLKFGARRCSCGETVDEKFWEDIRIRKEAAEKARAKRQEEQRIAQEEENARQIKEQQFRTRAEAERKAREGVTVFFICSILVAGFFIWIYAITRNLPPADQSSTATPPAAPSTSVPQEPVQAVSSIRRVPATRLPPSALSAPTKDLAEQPPRKVWLPTQVSREGLVTHRYVDGDGVVHTSTNPLLIKEVWNLNSRSGTDRTIALTFTINSEGYTEDVKVVESSGSAEIDDQAISSVGQWLYKPATENGEAKASIVHVERQFRY